MKNIQDIITALVKYDSSTDIAKIQACYGLAQALHFEQKRLSGEPYETHFMEVAYILAGLKMDSDTICAAFLHDVLEDSTMPLEELAEKVGPEISTLVDGVTKLSFKVKPDKEIRQADNFRKILLAMSKDIRVIIIKLADRLHNMRTLQYLPEDKKKENAQETLDIYAPLAHRLGMGSLKWELEDLAMKHLYSQEYSDLGDMVSKRRKTQRCILLEQQETNCFWCTNELSQILL